MLGPSEQEIVFSQGSPEKKPKKTLFQGPPKQPFLRKIFKASLSFWQRDQKLWISFRKKLSKNCVFQVNFSKDHLIKI